MKEEKEIKRIKERERGGPKERKRKTRERKKKERRRSGLKEEEGREGGNCWEKLPERVVRRREKLTRARVRRPLHLPPIESKVNKTREERSQSRGRRTVVPRQLSGGKRLLGQQLGAAAPGNHDSFGAGVTPGQTQRSRPVVPAATPRMGSFSLSLFNSLPLLQCFRYKYRAGIDIRTVIRTSDHPLRIKSMAVYNPSLVLCAFSIPGHPSIGIYRKDTEFYSKETLITLPSLPSTIADRFSSLTGVVNGVLCIDFASPSASEIYALSNITNSTYRMAPSIQPTSANDGSVGIIAWKTEPEFVKHYVLYVKRDSSTGSTNFRRVKCLTRVPEALKFLTYINGKFVFNDDENFRVDIIKGVCQKDMFIFPDDGLCSVVNIFVPSPQKFELKITFSWVHSSRIL
ncbi:uncharacterized protein G2W53_001357 [Senna tora]|uniref:Uncharacterized protein n=1 Tax=Senna tora TaxID=362788 RepID=A0A834XG34_9FABA|nr:uncharacterized protein G2W53_001357 [Senna tora]